MAGNCKCKECSALKNRSFKWREIISWGMLDFSNSIVLMVNFGSYPAYAKDGVFVNYEAMVDAQMIINVVSGVFIFLISPPLGALTDIMHFRVALTIISSLIYSVATICYYPIVKGSEKLFMAMHFFVKVFFRVNESVTAAYLPNLCAEKDVGFVSSFGYFIGFLSGIITMLQFKDLTTVDTTGLDPDQTIAALNKAYSTAMLNMGIIMFLACLPPILMMNDGIPKGEKRPKWKWSYIGESFKQNGRTFKTAFSKENKVIALILIDYGIMCVPLQALGGFMGSMATQFGASYGLTRAYWQTVLIVYNAAVAVSAIIYGIISRWVSAKILVGLSFVLLILASIFGCCWHLIPYDPEAGGANPAYAWVWTEDIVMSVTAGPMQALMRGLIGLLAKPEQKNEIFGVLESMVIFGNLLGTTIPGLLIKTSTWPFFVFSTAFFVVGFIIFMFIPIMKAEKEAYAKAKEKRNKEKEMGADVIVDAEIKNVEGSSVSGGSVSSSSDSSKIVSTVSGKLIDSDPKNGSSNSSESSSFESTSSSSSTTSNSSDRKNVSLSRESSVVVERE